MSIPYKHHISLYPDDYYAMPRYLRRSFISIIVSKTTMKDIPQNFKRQSFISIIFPFAWIVNDLVLKHMCRSFISIIFSQNIVGDTITLNMVSILYKYHISLTKYSIFLALFDKIVEK